MLSFLFSFLSFLLIVVVIDVCYHVLFLNFNFKVRLLGNIEKSETKFRI